MSLVQQTLQRILIVDDNPMDRRLAIHELSREFKDLDIREAADLQTFERVFAEESFDLIITDYELHWATGIDILQTVKNRLPDMPVIMFTDSGSQEIAVEAMKAGLDDYVLKSPKHLIRLSQAVRLAWENSQIRQRANELEIRQRFLLNQLQVGVFRANIEGQLIDVNDGFLTLLGLASFEEAKEFFHQKFEFKTINRLQTGRNKWEQQLQRSDGEDIWLQVNETLNQQGDKTVIDGLVSDITEKKKASLALAQFNTELETRVQERTRQLEATNQKLQVTNQELELLAYSLSHDLRTPIRQIHSLVDLLQEELEPAPISATARNYLQSISRLTDQGSRMITDLLEYSRTGRTEITWVTVDMNQIVQTIHKQVTTEHPDRSIEWQIDPLPNVEGDRSLLKRVWQNLISNAVKYTREEPHPKIIIRGRDEGDTVIYSIEDNGAGFDVQYIDRIFTLFQRLHREDEFEGSGIGLANVKRILHRHNGEIWASGQVGVGASFQFSLPKSRNAS